MLILADTAFGGNEFVTQVRDSQPPCSSRDSLYPEIGGWAQCRTIAQTRAAAAAVRVEIERACVLVLF